MIKRLIILMVLLCAGCLAQTPEYSGEDIQQLVNGMVSWSAEPNQLNSPGAKAELREAERHGQEGHLAVSYDVYVTGAPRNQTYAVLQWPIGADEPQVLRSAVSIARDGRVCSETAPDCVGPVRFSMIPAKGEPFRGVLMSKDGKYKLTTFVVPNPITSSDQGCRLEVVRLTPKFEVALVRGKGFKPNENVQVTGDSAGEAIDGTTAVDANGSFNTVLTPFVKGKQTGVDNVKFKGSACAPAISFQWGTAQE